VQMNDPAAEVARLESLLDTLLRSVSHDLRSPLLSISLSAELIELGGEGVAEATRALRAGVADLERMLQAVTLLSQARRRELNVAPVALGDLLAGRATIKGHFVRYLALSLETAHFEDQQSFTIIKHGDLRIRCLALIGVSKSAADADHAFGKRRTGNQPSSNIHLMYALVADVAVARVPEPVPVVMNKISVIRLKRCGSKPDVEVQLLRRRGVFLRPDAAARLVAESSRHG